MPIYEYECEACKKAMEVTQRITDDPLTRCPSCGGRLHKLISNTSFILKGSGWYATDYGRKDSGRSQKRSEAKPSSESGDSGGSGSSKTEKKDDGS